MIKNGTSFTTPSANAQSPVVRARPISARGSISNGVNSPIMPHPAPPLFKSQDFSEVVAQQRSDIESILLLMNDFRRDVTSLKSAVEELKAESLSGAGRNSRYGSGFPKEFEALTDNVSRLNSRVGDLDGLRLEMLVTKRRVKLMEDNFTPSTQSSHTVTGYTPQSTQGFPSAAPNNEATPNAVTSRSMQQVTAGRKETPKSTSVTPQVEETPTPSSSNFMLISEAQRTGPLPGTSAFHSSKSVDRDLYGVSPEYRARRGPEVPNDVSHRPIAPSAPVPQPNQPMAPSTFVSAPEPHVRSTPPVAPINQFTTVNRPIATSRHLNDTNVVQISDPEDDDYAPDSQKPPSPRAPLTRGPRRGEKVRLPTPDWEKPGWAGPREPTRTSPHDKPSPRHSNSNRTMAPSPKRRKTTAFEFEQGLPPSWTEGSAHSTQQPSSTFSPTQSTQQPSSTFTLTQSTQQPSSSFTPTQNEPPPPVAMQGMNGAFQPSPYPDNPHQLEPPARLESELPRPREPIAKPKDPSTKEKQDLRSVRRTRDEQGRLLRPDGKVDGRSVRYGTPNPKRRASAGVPANIASKPPATAAVATVNSPAPVPIAVNTPPDVVAVNKPPAVATPAAANSPVAVNSPNTVNSPAAVNSRPATVNSPPAAVNSPPAAVNSPPATVNSPPAAVSSPPAAVNSPPAAASSPPAAFNSPPAAVNSPPAVVNSPPTAAPTPVAVNTPPVTTPAAAPSPAAPTSPNSAPPATRQASLREKRKLRRSGGGRDRDEEGNLLSRSGKVDGRSLRYKRAKERMEAERAGSGERLDRGEEGGGGDEEAEDGDGRGQLVGD